MIDLEQFQRDGFAIADHVLSREQLIDLRRASGELPDDAAVRRRGAERAGAYGVRNLFQLVPAVRELARAPEIRELIEPVLGKECFAVRAILFDKIAPANWKVGWHQDKFIAVRQRIDVDGFGPWSQKAGVWQVIPPVAILKRMVALRIHLDDCLAENGPLRVLPGTHRLGWLDGRVADSLAEIEEVVCEAPAGGVLAMRPLLLHASSPAASPSHRRVIHVEFAADELPGRLQWHERA